MEAVKKLLHDNISGEHLESIIEWHQLKFKERAVLLTQMMCLTDTDDDERAQEVEHFHKLLLHLDNTLKTINGGATYFSGSDTMCHLDIILFNDLMNIISMYNPSKTISENKYRVLRPWMDRMMTNPVISEAHGKMIQILTEKKLMGDYMKD